MSAVKTIGIIGGAVADDHRAGAPAGGADDLLDPAEDAPAFKISDERIVGRFDDPAALEELCRRSDVVTYELRTCRATCWWLSSKNTISNKGSGLCSTRRIACGRRATPAITD